MTGPYGVLFEKVLTRVDPERAHHGAFRAIRAAGPVLRGVDRLARHGTGVRAMGLEFPSVLGLAAGFDKNAVGIDALAALGFGFVEVGTVTGEPQGGNPRPRLARLPLDRAVVNRMGFNNDGAEAVARRLAARAARLAHGRGERQGLSHRPRPSVVLGVNIGKTKVVPEDAAIGDYEKSTGLLAPYADYLVVNVSSPNTPGLRDLQAVAKLEPLLRAVRRRADEATADRDRRVPLLVKIAPDLSDDDVLAVADLAVAIGLDGIVATNTTTSRAGLLSPPEAVERAGVGGLSGEPLRRRALEVLRLLRGRVGDELTLVGVGGISGVEDAVERLNAGADLLQAYTAFVYEGPLWPRRINAALAKEAAR
ncbi:quinone-dependent dihydroorotate dehydrogenase [Nocardioides pocheonensis]|uniref:Dihydroorotate dehydrogenase (quinone) n=1 Tax=Nocardioides pocheonensis TaxID=661485 RepID=A0A3N0GFS8_9ACTN|nr:quinone-dependent dihydroorotate dehydrogenase [Nocardioides pocheonensis]RNM11032.1 quinone-dependent dihydroorotate dehydrogenase [Nocardioides pocheonensis]